MCACEHEHREHLRARSNSLDMRPCDWLFAHGSCSLDPGDSRDAADLILGTRAPDLCDARGDARVRRRMRVPGGSVESVSARVAIAASGRGTAVVSSGLIGNATMGSSARAYSMEGNTETTCTGRAPVLHLRRSKV